MSHRILCIIPARGGSKGLPGKNILPLGDQPLIYYSIDTARAIVDEKDICVSTDSSEISSVVAAYPLSVPFTRPAELASDTAGTHGVLVHALTFYAEVLQQEYDYILLLQPTSPFRKTEDIQAMIEMMNQDTDTEMVVSVGLSEHNPYYSLFEEDQKGFLKKSKEGYFERRQDCPPVYYYNGSAYVIRVASLKDKQLHELKNVRKFVMEQAYCQDIDTPLDFLICKTMLNEGFIQ